MKVLLAGFIASGLFMLAIAGKAKTTAEPQDKDNEEISAEVIGHSDGTLKFVDFGYMLDPDDYHGRVFRLSQDYPKKNPKLDKDIGKILQIDFRRDWRTYLEAVREYVFAGNATTDYENSFFLEDNEVRPWYHVPWQHWGSTGREGYHGLTQEGPIAKQMLAPTQTNGNSHAYAVGFYNVQGGYTIGKLWPSTTAPDFSYFADGNGFPEGTVVAKVLFTTFGEEEVPYLANPLSWNAYIYESDKADYVMHADEKGKNGIKNTDRVTAKVNLIQMDLMIRDSRAPAGWVFGNFAYNGLRNEKNRWYNLVPVGIMWGNDPDIDVGYTNPTPEKTQINPDLKQTIINPDKSELPPMHLGWGGRLDGPVDNAASSCMSCHSTAQYPAKSAIMPFLQKPKSIPIPKNGETASEKWMKWFRNVPCADTFDEDTITLDYSMQMLKSVQNYIEWRDQSERGHFAVEYGSRGHKVRRNSGS